MPRHPFINLDHIFIFQNKYPSERFPFTTWQSYTVIQITYLKPRTSHRKRLRIYTSITFTVSTLRTIGLKFTEGNLLSSTFSISIQSSTDQRLAADKGQKVVSLYPGSMQCYANSYILTLNS